MKKSKKVRYTAIDRPPAVVVNGGDLRVQDFREMKADSFPTTAALLLPFSSFFLMATSGARWDPSSSLLISILSSLIAPYNIAEEGKAGEISRDLGKSV